MEREYCVLKYDISFNNPYSAAYFCLGEYVDGMKEWVDEEGKELVKLIQAVKEETNHIGD